MPCALRPAVETCKIFGPAWQIFDVRSSVDSHCVQVEIPEWYSRGQLPSAEEATVASLPAPERDDLLHFSVLEGDAAVLDRCEDSLEFLQLLSALQRPQSEKEAASELPELRAARSLFRPEVHH